MVLRLAVLLCGLVGADSLRASSGVRARKSQPLRALPGTAAAAEAQASAPKRSRLTLGAPRFCPESGTYVTAGGVGVTRTTVDVPTDDVESKVENLIDALDSRRGVLLASSYEFPGRYARWTVGLVDPPLELSGRDRDFALSALNERGSLMIAMFTDALRRDEAVESVVIEVDAKTGKASRLVGRVKAAAGVVLSEEERSRQPSLMSVVRRVTATLYHPDEPQLGLYGALGYDLMFQFEPIEKKQKRDDRQRDIVLFIPDRILVVDQRENAAWEVEYDFTFVQAGAVTQIETVGMARDGKAAPYEAAAEGSFPPRDMDKGTFADLTQTAKHEFEVGNLFEVVLSQQWSTTSPAPPSSLFRTLRKRNPSPYGFLMNLGGAKYLDAGDAAEKWIAGHDRGEYLVGASPEMFVRVERVDGKLRVETCPISGTIERGADALEDASQVRLLLGSTKDESELTMCTDVDRNDKSRICVPGSVAVLGRRQIEMYSRLIHTVDHVEGYLREGFDALDAFLCHTWAVTVTGAPKSWAARFIEANERSARAWYGGAVGHVAFDGSLNTGLTLRTIHFRDGIASVRAGATLLYDSDCAAEEAETELKASAMVDALKSAGSTDDVAKVVVADAGLLAPTTAGIGKRVLLVDHEDSFVHTLANYLRQTSADVRVARSGAAALAAITNEDWDLVVLSPGPGRPSDFGLSATLDLTCAKRIPVFGVCLGLQGMCEHFGGKLGQLAIPVHGKPSVVDTLDQAESNWRIFEGLPKGFEVARYHSLYADTLPDELRVTARVRDDVGICMALEHKSLPIAGVQFHPESILTNPRHGLRILANALVNLKYADADVPKARAEADVAV
ncbi:ADC synthase [Pelagophyceae sp. CCMP2097]|nr:ADC synthase [Pelagophyceae sp. CCMP2097]